MLAKFYKYIFFSLITLILLLPTTYYFSNFINDIDNSLLDLKYKFKEFFNEDSLKISKYILLVDNGDATRIKLNHESIKLKEWNKYLETLISFKTATIALYLPFYFPDSDNKATDDFLEILNKNKNIILPGILDHDIQINSRNMDIASLNMFRNLPNIKPSSLTSFKNISLPYEKILAQNPQIGFSNLLPDPDGVIRKIPLIANFSGKTVFSYTLTTLISFLDIDVKSIQISNNTLFLKSLKYNKNLKIPLTEDNEMYIQFFTDFNKKFLQAQFHDIYNSTKRINLDNHVVINVDSASYGHQKYKTPIDPFMPGGLLVAAALNTIISELFTTPRTINDMYLSIMFLAIILIIAALTFSPTNKTIPFINKNSLFILFSFLILVFYPILTCIVFTYLQKELSTITPMLYMLIFVIIASSYKMVIENRERRLLINTLKGFISEKKLNFLMTPVGSDLMLKTRKKEVSILLTDIVDFSNWSTFHNPDFTFQTLKKYYNTIENIVFKNNGTIDKKMGDALLAFFGDLDDTSSHANDALNTAIEIQIELKKHNFPFLTRIGINSGEVTIGNLGSKQHLDYTVIGNAVNFTKRIEANCIPGGILIGPATHEKLTSKEEFELSPIKISLKEQNEILTCYNVIFNI